MIILDNRPRFQIKEASSGFFVNKWLQNGGKSIKRTEVIAKLFKIGSPSLDGRGLGGG